MSEPLTPEEEAEIRKMDATFEQDNPNDYARPDWLVGLLHERRRLLATLDAARALPAPDERQAGLREALETMAAAYEAINPRQRGPWRWGGYRRGPMMLTTVARGMVYVMGFIRHGMRGAQPTFQTYADPEHPDWGVMTPASELVVQEVPYRDDIDHVDHPVAKFILAAGSIDWAALAVTQVPAPLDEERLAAALRTDAVQDVILRWMPTDQTSHVARVIAAEYRALGVEAGIETAIADMQAEMSEEIRTGQRPADIPRALGDEPKDEGA